MGQHRALAIADAEAEQEPAIRLLSDPATHGGAPVTRIDTHISHVFVAAGRALKLKRAIRRNFLDYSSVEKRRAACLRELEVNRRTAPALYLGVLPVTRGGGRLALGGEGEAVDWVVEMQAFDRSQEFDRLAEEGRLSEAQVTALADVIAAFHARAERRPDQGGAEAVAATIRQVAGAIEAASPAAGRTARAWREAALGALGPLRPRLESRRRHGFVRRCHGDLHLGNVVLVDGRPTPYDAIEFNEAMATTDILYDLAFPVMDLLAHGERRLASALLNRALARSRDWSGAGLLPLFISMRAAVRAIAAAGRAEAEAARLLALASAVLADRPPPRLIAIGGVSGSGKSTLAHALAPRLGGPFGALLVRSDVARKVLMGVEPEASLPAEAYLPEVTRRVYASLLRDAGRALRAGATVILDATFLDPAERAAAASLAARAGAAFEAIWLEGPAALFADRIAARVRDASDATPAVLARQVARDTGPIDWTRLAAGAEAVAETALAHLARRGVPLARPLSAPDRPAERAAGDHKGRASLPR
ncbi:MAG TPA: AAA family ATPase [Paracoccaceae bacterium]|nr:AAA family ATPase [Paracoccaceae bacterium]